MRNHHKMLIEIWSDIACPFCFIGKHQLEIVLENFPQADKIEVVWKTFILDPSIPMNSKHSLLEYLSKEKSVDISQIEKLTQQINQQANNTGVNFNFNKSIAANTINGHRVSHLAKTKSAKLQNKAEDLLFRAYFMQGKNINDISILIEIGLQLGFTKEEIKKTIKEKKFSEAIEKDKQQAITLGINVVPYFLF